MIILYTFIVFGLLILLGFGIKKLLKPEESEDEIREKFARLYLGIEHYNTLQYTESTTDWLDTIIAEGLESGIKKYTHDMHHLYIDFNNGVSGRLWNENRYYGWLGHGVITTIDEETNESVQIQYSSTQPTAYAMYKLRIGIDKYLNEPNTQDSKITNLPHVKVTRNKIEN